MSQEGPIKKLVSTVKGENDGASLPDSMQPEPIDFFNAVQSAVKGDDKNGKPTEKVEPKDFFWDQIVKYLSSIILALTILNVTVQLFRDGGVSCFIPPDTIALLLSLPDNIDSTINGFTRDQAAYLNNYCIGSIPPTEFFPVFVLAHGLLMVAPHFIWSAIFKGDFDSFFSIAGKIDRLRDGKTGEYSKENFDRVQKLGVEYGGSNRRIFASYVGKLCLQLVVCVISIGLSAGWLREFSFSFRCPRELAEEKEWLNITEDNMTIVPEWPLNITIPCVYTPLRVLSVVRTADFVLTAVAAVLIVYGFIWCFIRHTKQLGHTQVAKFAFESCLKPELYAFPPYIQYRGCKFLKEIQETHEFNGCLHYIFWLFIHRPHSFRLLNYFSPRIKSDLDFLLLQLFRADASHGKVFKEIQISKKLKELLDSDQQELRFLRTGSKHKRLTSPEEEEEKRDTFSDTGQTTMPESPKEEGDTVISIPEPSSFEKEDGDSPSKTEQTPEDQSTGVRTPSSSVPKDKPKKGSCAHCMIYYCSCCLKRKKKQSAIEQKKINKMVEEDGDSIPNPERGLPVDSMKSRLDQFIRDYTLESEKLISNCSAVDVSFGITGGYHLVLSKDFKKVISVIFHPFYRADYPDVVKGLETFSNFFIITYPDDIYTRSVHHQSEANQKLLDRLAGKPEDDRVDLILVGPVVNELQKVSVNIFLDLICFKCISKNARLLTIRPLRIGSKKIPSYKYVPSTASFHNITKEEDLQDVDGGPLKGYKVRCAGVSCIFEFEAYEYVGEIQSMEEIRAYEDAHSRIRRGHARQFDGVSSGQEATTQAPAFEHTPSPDSVGGSPSHSSSTASGRVHRRVPVKVDVEQDRTVSGMSANGVTSSTYGTVKSCSMPLARSSTLPSRRDMRSTKSK